MKIAQVLIADAWGGVDAGSLERGIGGREGSMIHLSREWAKLGHEVTNFVPTTKPTRIYEDKGYNAHRVGFHEYVPMPACQVVLRTIKYDAVVAWECPLIYEDPRVREIQDVRMVEMQCAHFPAGEAKNASLYASGVCALSQWHKDFLLHDGLEMPEDKVHVLPNCVNIEDYPVDDVEAVVRSKLIVSKSFFYSSSPDRGLVHLLEVWPAIRSKWPQATLKVGYGYTRWTDYLRWAHVKEGELALDLEDGMKQPGVQDVGKLGHRELAQIQKESTALLYPCDTIGPTETGCITAIEAMAAVTPVLTTDADCMAEEFGEDALIVNLPWDPAKYFDAVVRLMEDEDLYRELAFRGRALAEKRDWRLIAPHWIKLFEEEARKC